MKVPGVAQINAMNVQNYYVVVAVRHVLVHPDHQDRLARPVRLVRQVRQD